MLSSGVRQMHRSQIKKVIEYIEIHLKEDLNGVLDNNTLARVAGYSEFHFLRVFRNAVGLTPADYIRKRRISEIVRHMGDSNRPMSDIAFEYGFNSKENFTRAFKKEHNILPTEFRSANCSLRLYAPFDFEPSSLGLSASLAYLQPFSLIAYRSDEDQPPKFWNKYNAESRSLFLSGGRITEDFGAMIWNNEEKKLDYFIGIRSEEACGDLKGTVKIDIDGGLFAIFETPPASQHDFVATIRRTWDYIYGEWLQNNGFKRRAGFELESYVESSKKYTERIYIPLERIKEES